MCTVHILSVTRFIDHPLVYTFAGKKKHVLHNSKVSKPGEFLLKVTLPFVPSLFYSLSLIDTKKHCTPNSADLRVNILTV